MNSLEKAFLFSLSSLLSKASSKSKVRKLLSTFQCSKNYDVEKFLHRTAIIFEEKGLSRTYLWFDEVDGKPTVLAYFTIALKAIYLGEETVNAIKQLNSKDFEHILEDLLKGYPLGEHNKQFPTYLIGQIGKHDCVKDKIGKLLVKVALTKIEEASKIVGGKIVILDVVEGLKEEVEGLVNLYRELGFKELYLFYHEGRGILRMYLKLE
jgi:hypothetical protein